MSPERVAILLATFNGGPFVGPQIQSLLAQTHTHWRLWVSDDGSQDDTLQTVKQSAGRKLYRITRGPGAGFAQNFLHLLRQVPDGHFAAFCDQDDIWHPDKLTRALRHLRGVQGPAMVCAGTQPCSEALTPLGPPTHQAPPSLGFQNALVQNQASGNTIVLNPAAIAKLKPASAAAWAVPAHDWWVYLCLSALDATLICDATPVLLYRQHARNAIGVNTGWQARARRLTSVCNGTYARWITANVASLRPLVVQMPTHNREIYQTFAAARAQPLTHRIRTAMNPPVQMANRPAHHAWQLAHALGRA